MTAFFCNLYRFGTVLCLSTMLCACNFVGGRQISDGPPDYHINVNNIPNAVPKYEARSKYGNPTSYVVFGKRYYVLQSAVGYNKRGIASWYGTKFQGRLTSSREPYNLAAMTAASRTLPIPCYVRVTNLENGRQVIVKVNDRGPFVNNRIIDLSYAAAKKLGYVEKGTALVQVTGINVRKPNAAPPVILTNHPRLYLQFGAFIDYSNATRLQNKLLPLTTRHVRIFTARTNGRTLYKVQVGPLKGVGESDALLAKFAHEGLGQAFTVIN